MQEQSVDKGLEKVIWSDNDISLVFGPGACKLQEEIQGGGVNAASDGSMSDSHKSVDTSTPLRKRSRGRARLRNSGRSSMSSPSPVRPPDNGERKKLKLDSDKSETPKCKQSENLDPSQIQDQALGDNLSDSGDWGSSFGEQKANSSVVKEGDSGKGLGESQLVPSGQQVEENVDIETVAESSSVGKDSGDSQGP